MRVLAVRPLFEKKLGRGTARDCENQNFRLETRGQSGKVPGLQLPAKTHRFCPRRTTQHTMCQLMGMQVSLHSIRVHLLVGLSQLPKERVLDIQRACAGNADSSTLYRAAGVAGIESMIWCTRNLVGGLAHQTLEPILRPAFAATTVHRPRAFPSRQLYSKWYCNISVLLRSCVTHSKPLRKVHAIFATIHSSAGFSQVRMCSSYALCVGLCCL